MSTTSSVAGRFITGAGKVTGPKAAGRTVTIQRKYVDGGPVSVAFPTIRNKGKFSARVELPQGGTTSFRALKASRRHARRVSVRPGRPRSGSGCT
jgi:hypothetical protein